MPQNHLDTGCKLMIARNAFASVAEVSELSRLVGEALELFEQRLRLIDASEVESMTE